MLLVVIFEENYFNMFLLDRDLSRNQLSSALEDTDSVFSTLTSLTRLSLDGNNIKSVSVHTFKGLSHLKQLNLMGNAITSIQENAFDPLKNLEQL